MIRTVPVASDPRGASDVPTEVSASTMGPAAASGDALARGTEIGRYLVLHRLGAGGMGTVYAAYDPQLDRKVAIKVVASTAASSDHAAARTSQLLREGRVLARLSHPNVVAVHDVGRLGEDIFIAMEYVSGQTLGQWVHTQRPGFAQVLDHYVAAGRALAAAHREDIVHGDFKPANAMVSDTGRVVVLDFGLARAIATGEHPSDSLLATVGGSGGGTPAYMAPEQHRGDPASPAADQFGYCVALYEALCGRRPFAGDTPVAVAANVLEGTPRAPTDAVPKWLWRVLRRGLQTDPRDRFPTFDALLTELDPAPRRRRRRMGLGVLGAVAAAVAVVVASRGPEPCTDASAAQGDAWTADSRDALQRQLAAHPGWPRVRDRLDDAAQRWRDHWTRACRATHVDGSQSADLLDRRMACLERARGHLAAFADGLRDADDETVSRAVAQVGGLDEGARCSDARTLLTRAPPPAEPGDRATYDRIIGQAQRARTEANLQGAASRALDRLAVLEPTADALDHPRAQRFVHQARGDALYGLGRHDEATEAYATAVRHAEIAGDDRAALELATELIHVHASSRDDVVTAAVWSDYADNKLARVEMVSSEARVDLLVHQATLVRRQGDPQTAVTMMDRALELASEDPAARGVIHHNRGIAYFNLAAHELAVGALRQAVELRTAAFGGDHLEVGRSRYHLAHALSAQGEGLAADLELERAIEIFGAHEGTQRQSIVARQSQATLAASRGQLPAAIELMQRTITDAVQTLGADNDELGTLHFNLGRMYMLQGRHDQAAASLERSLALEQQRRGPTHPALAEVLAMIAEIEVHRQRAPAAITHLRRARSLAGTQRHRLRAEVGLVHAQLHIDCDLATAQRDAHKLIDAARPEAPSIPGLSDDLDRMAQLVEGWRDDEHLPACRPTPNHRPAQPDSPR